LSNQRDASDPTFETGLIVEFPVSAGQYPSSIPGNKYMGMIILLIFYGSILFSVIGSIVRLAKFANAPLHLRWELYRGSSVYELPEWWTKPQVTSFGKMKSVALDVLFLRDYYHRNRGFWYFLFLFHSGIYFLILWHLWLFIGALTTDAGAPRIWGLAWGHGATALAIIGSVGILIKRMTDEDLRVYYPPLHYLKWLFVILTLLEAFYAVQIYFEGSMPALMNYVKQQLTFEDLEMKFHPHMATAAHILFASAWLVYLPFSHILRLFFRYYHHVRWDDVPNVRGSALERKVKRLLDQPVRWSAPHIPRGRKWEDVSSEREQGTKGSRNT
jgi:nitrate reductase gamma subunit